MKKIIAVAVAGALLSPLVFAEVKLEGEVGLRFNYKKIGKDKSDNFSGWGNSISLTGSEQINDLVKLEWGIEKEFDMDDKSLSLDAAYLGFSGGFGELKFGRFKDVDGYLLPGNGVGVLGGINTSGNKFPIIKYKTPNLTGDDSNDLTAAFSLHYKNGDKSSKAGHSYYLNLKYEGKYGDAGELSTSYVWAKVTESKSDKIFSGPQSHYLGAIYKTAKAADNSFLAVGGFFKHNKEGEKSSQNEVGVSLLYDTGDLGLTPRIQFVQGLDARVDGKKVKDSGYSAFAIESGYRVTKNVSTFVGYGFKKPKAKGADKTDMFRVGVKTKF